MANLRIRMTPQFPTTVTGDGGIAVVKENGAYKVEPDWSALALETTISDPEDRELWVRDGDTGTYTRLSVKYLIDNLPDGATIFVQNSAPPTNVASKSLWVDTDTATLDLYQLISGVWTDTGTDLRGTIGPAGPSYAATSSSSQTIGNTGAKTFTTQSGLAYSPGARVRATSGSNWMEGVVSSYSGTTLVFTADKSSGSGTFTSWTINLAGQPGADGAGIGDVTAASAFGTDNRLIRSDGTGKGVQSSGITVSDDNDLTGIRTYSFDRGADITGTDLNSLALSGPFYGNTLTNAPNGDSGWWYIESLSFFGGATYAKQLATPIGGSQIYLRASSNGPWSAWRQVWPISGGTVTTALAAASDVPAATSDRILTTNLIASASAWTTVTYAASVALNWASQVNPKITLTGNLQIANPTNGQPGTFRNIWLLGNDATVRALTFGNQFTGDLPSISDITSTKQYVITVLCISATQFSASAKQIA